MQAEEQRWCAISQASTARAQAVESGCREHSLDLLRDTPQGAQRVLIRGRREGVEVWGLACSSSRRQSEHFRLGGNGS